jgi:hypothetical protein
MASTQQEDVRQYAQCVYSTSWCHSLQNSEGPATALQGPPGQSGPGQMPEFTGSSTHTAVNTVPALGWALQGVSGPHMAPWAEHCGLSG